MAKKYLYFRGQKPCLLRQGWIMAAQVFRFRKPLAKACGASFYTLLLAVFLLGIIQKGGLAMALKIQSPAFKDGEEIPALYTCQGKDVSPYLKWEGAPQNTKSFALISDDPDAPMGTWVHWVIFNIPPQVNELPEGVKKTNNLENGAAQGLTDFGRVGYGGPCPPPGKYHRYFFKLYALDIIVDLDSSSGKDDLLKAMEGHILDKAEIVGRFKR